MTSDAMTRPPVADGARVVAQPVAAPLTRAAIFLVVTIQPGPETRATLRSFCGDLSTLFRAVEFRDLEAGLSCVIGFGSDAWGSTLRVTTASRSVCDRVQTAVGPAPTIVYVGSLP
jgi:deferrochelatase/peroxidase EfeB